MLATSAVEFPVTPRTDRAEPCERFANGRSPVTPVLSGSPVQLVSVPDAGVPSAGVVVPPQLLAPRARIMPGVAPSVRSSITLRDVACGAVVPPVGLPRMVPDVMLAIPPGGSPVALARLPDDGVSRAP